MVSKYTQLARNIRAIVAKDPRFQNLHSIYGIVKSIEDDTCTVEISQNFEISDIKLKSTANGENNLLTIPKIGSRVTMISNDGSIDNLTIIKVDVAEKIVFNENGLNVEIDSTDGKVMIKNDNASLFDLLQDLTNLLKQLKVYTSMGPSGTPLPDSILSIEKFETDFKKLLK
ncbi:hypothetical protein [Epilithonimonas xixisoli]|uniref:Uncharacterized protein n=1 Tax=Epilithonimonas xixisoli TaxID=1476462 RepID=A0A4R8I9W3_9FLAO|nr:hypothetical protein [Epilithonimonas xixisoli]TDX84051.1 hypothetical protein B0I22_1645 [Epilithonimonas xixisoli]